MMICRSKLKIFKKGEKEDFECEILVLNSLKEGEENQIIIIAKNKEGSFKNYNLEDFNNTCFYDYLNDLVQKHIDYNLSNDMYYLLSVFASNLALNYININKHSEPVTMENIVDKENNIFSKITTFELSIKLILKDILDMDCLTDLYDDSFKFQMNRHIEKEMLEKIGFLKSIKIDRIVYSNSNSVVNKIEKINGYSTYDIILDSLYETRLQVSKVDNIEFAYTRGIFINHKKSKKSVFIEDCQSDRMLIIVNKGKYTTEEIIRKFYLKNAKCLGKVVIGITYCSNINFI